MTICEKCKHLNSLALYRMDKFYECKKNIIKESTSFLTGAVTAEYGKCIDINIDGHCGSFEERKYPPTQKKSWLRKLLKL